MTFDRHSEQLVEKDEEVSFKSDFAQTLTSDVKKRSLLHAMADFDANCVVLLGNDRLGDSVAAKMVAEYREYERQQSATKVLDK